MESSKKDSDKIAILLTGVSGTGKSTTASYLEKILLDKGKKVLLIRFDEFRKNLIDKGIDPFSKDPNVKEIIYGKAAVEFLKYLNEGYNLIIDSGLSVEKIRLQIKNTIPEIRICHIYCPLFIAIYRDTKRSLLNEKHERGSYLHLRALFSYVNPLQKEKFPQPGITYRFEYPYCADLHINSFLRRPEKIAREILDKLEI